MSFPAPIDPDLLFGQFENAGFPVWLLNRQLEVTRANSCAQTSYPERCLLDGIRVLLPPPDADELREAIQSGNGLVKQPTMLSRPDLAISFNPWVSPDGERGAIALLVPVAPAIANLRQNLEGVGNLVITNGLRRCMSDMTYSLAACSAKLREAGVALADEQLRQMNHSCYQMMRATGNLEEKIKLSAQLTAAPQMVEFWSCCAELLDACGLLLRRNALSFSYDLPDSVVYLECDFRQISTALLNLISNVYLYGGDAVHLSITGQDLGDRVLLTVSDNGPGLPSEVTARLFQPFCTWDTLSRADAGMGLGLHLVRGIVMQAGGTVTVNSGDGGTTVALSLPMATQPPPGAAELGSSSVDYVQDRFSPLYFALCDVIKVPEL